MSHPDWQPQSAPPPREPAFNLPPTVLALLIANVGVHLLLSVVPFEAWRWTLVNLAFIPVHYSVEGLGRWPAWVAPVTYQFLHGGWLHLLMNMAMLMAFGSALERAIGRNRMLTIYLLSGIAGAFTHFAIYPDASVPVIGASGSISGLFAATLWLMARPDRFGRRNLRFWPAALIWIGISVLIGFTGMPGATPQGASIAWAAHLGGFAAGLVLMMLVIAKARRR